MSADFQNIADYYDAMYVDPKEYEQEAEKTAQIIEYYSKSDNPRILDIACGTGEQSLYLAKHYQVTGIDLSREMLDKAREKVPDVEFLEKDMLDFKLEHRYRAAVNLYGSIGFAENLQRMEAGIRCVWDCLEEGGVLILTPWGTRETFSEGSIADCRQRNGVNFCRMETVKRAAGDRVQVEMFHLIGRGRTCGSSTTFRISPFFPRRNTEARWKRRVLPSAPGCRSRSFAWARLSAQNRRKGPGGRSGRPLPCRNDIRFRNVFRYPATTAFPPDPPRRHGALRFFPNDPPAI